MLKWLDDILLYGPQGEHLWSELELASIDKGNWLELNWNSEWQHALRHEARMQICKEAIACKGPTLEIGVGAGGGNLSPILHLDMEHQLIINDIDPRITKRWERFLARKAASNVASCAFDAAKMPFKNKSIACVSSRGGISNCRADSAHVLSECARVLKLGGMLVLYELCISQNTLSKLPHELLYLNAWARGEWRHLVETHGFAVISDSVAERLVVPKEESALALDMSIYGIELEVEWRAMTATIVTKSL